MVEKVEDSTTPELVEHLLQQVYGEEAGLQGRLPREVLVPTEPSNATEYAQWLGGLRGARVRSGCPSAATRPPSCPRSVKTPSTPSSSHKSRRAGDLTMRSQALQEIQEALELPVALLRIECFDISHVQGTNVVGSMVVVEDGLPKKSEYRKSRDRSRRHRRTAAMETCDPPVPALPPREERAGCGRGQPAHQAAVDAATAAAIADSTTPAPRSHSPTRPTSSSSTAANRRQCRRPGAGGTGHRGRVRGRLAKRLEEVWLPESDFPVILPRASAGLYLLQRIRDEAHRFAITSHRQKRGKAMTASALDSVPGLGESKRKALLAEFGP